MENIGGSVTSLFSFGPSGCRTGQDNSYRDPHPGCTTVRAPNMFTCWISLNRASASFLSEVRDACLLSNSFNYTQQQQHIWYASDGSIATKMCSVYACCCEICKYILDKHMNVCTHVYTYTRTWAHHRFTHLFLLFNQL